MAKNVTTVNVAKQAGVSQSTVSRVLNNHQGISRAKRTQVLAAMRELGYRGTARKSRRKIGIVICPLPEQKNMMALKFFETQIEAQQDFLQEANAETVIVNLPAGADCLGLAPSRLQELSGAILLNSPSVKLEESLRKQYLPFVVNTGAALPRGISCDTVGPDEEETCRRGCDFLLSKCSSFDIMMSERNLHRLEGYQRELRLRNLPPVQEEGIHIVPTTDIACFIDATYRMIQSGRRPAALLVDFYDAAISIRSILAFNGIRVPEDILLFTYSHSPDQDKLPALCQDPAPLGRMAARRLLELIRNPGDPPYGIRIPMTLVNTSTTGAM